MPKGVNSRGFFTSTLKQRVGDQSDDIGILRFPYRFRDDGVVTMSLPSRAVDISDVISLLGVEIRKIFSGNE